jgi:hypothetical protein
MVSRRKNKVNQDQIDEFLKRAAKTKLERRIELANLPFPEKVRIVVELQKIRAALDKAAGRKPKRVWKI